MIPIVSTELPYVSNVELFSSKFVACAASTCHFADGRGHEAKERLLNVITSKNIIPEKIQEQFKEYKLKIIHPEKYSLIVQCVCRNFKTFQSKM